MATLAESVVLSSLAPTEFQVLSSFDSRTTISVAVEHCQLCGGSRRPFYCRQCIQKGDFEHSGYGGQLSSNTCSTPINYKFESYADKLSRWNDAKQKHLELTQRFSEKTSSLHRCSIKKMKLAQLKMKNELLQISIDGKNEQLTKDSAQLSTLRLQNSSTLENISSTKLEMDDVSAQIKAHKDHLNQMLKRQERKNDKILSLRRMHIEHLIQFIFPIETVQQKSSDSDMQLKARVSMLAEARHTAYVKGRWIRGHSEWEEMYRIVQPVLPGNGDYNLSSSPALEGVDSVLHTSVELPRRNESWNIMAGLCFTTQLVDQLAYYLGIRLPWNLQCRDFCSSDMTERKFNTAVFKLSCNVLHLCYTQGVNLEGLHPRHTIYNIRALLDHPDIGKSIVSSDGDPMNMLEESLLNGSEELDLSDSMEKVDAAERDWEHVSVTLPELEMPTRGATTSFFSTALQSQSRTSQETQSTMTSLASGLVTSAITSIWRGWGKSDK